MTHETVDEYVDLTDKHDIMNCYYLYYKRVEWAQAWTWPHDQDVRDVGAKARRRGRREELWLQDNRAIAPGEKSPGLKVLHRTTSGIKLNRTVIVGSKLAHRYEILNKVRGNKNIIKKERTWKLCGTSSSDG